MGEMVMNMFDRNNFVLTGLDKKQKLQSLGIMCAVIFFFILSAFTFMNFMYCFADCIGSIVCSSMDIALRDALRSMPIFLSFFLSLSGLMVAHTFYRNESEDILRKRAVKHAIIGIALGAILIVYVIVMLIAGKYLSLVEGAPSAIYPLDALLYALLYIALGTFVIIYFNKLAPSYPYVGVKRTNLRKKVVILGNVFRTLWLLFALYGFCGFFYSIFIVDFKHGYVAYSLAMMLVSLVAFLSIAVWELYYNNLTEEKRKEITLPLAIISVAVSVVSAIVYLIALKFNLDGPSNVGFGLLPVAFSASVNLATLLVVTTPVIVSVTALIKGIIRRKKA